MEKIKLWIGISRPRTLFASFCPVAVALLLTGIEKTLIAIITLVCALSLQVLSNFINDYYDFRRGSDKAGRVGPARALAEGIVTPTAMRNACLITLGVAIATGLSLVLTGGWIILIIGVLSIILAWLYTATRHSLSYLGIADGVCFCFYGPIATFGTAFLQTHDFQPYSVAAGVACGCIAVCVLATNNIRDMEDDRGVGKKTFPVRFGKTVALVGVAIMLIIAQTAMFVALDNNWWMLLWAIPAAMTYRALCKAEGVAYNRCLFRFGLLNLAFVVLAAIIVLIF